MKAISSVTEPFARQRMVDAGLQVRPIATLILLTIFLAGSAAIASQPDDGWHSFRNGGNSGVAAASLPFQWSPAEGIAWQVELPGYGQSSPLVVGDKLLVTAVEGPNKETNLIVCLDPKTGETRWTASQPSSMQGPSNFMHSRAAPTPIATDSAVIAFFESGDLIAVGIDDGDILWQRDLKKETGALKSNHGLGSSLAQSKDMVFVNIEHDGPSALFAIEKSNGETKWKTERPSGSSWSSPVVMNRNGQAQVVVSSGGEAAGYDSQSGKQLWKVTGLAGNTVPSPVVDGDRIILGARMPEFGSVETAAKSNLCLEFSNDNVEPKVAWRSERCIADYASPVVSGEHAFLINGKGILGCLNKETGEEKYRHRLGLVCWATPIVDGDRLFVFGKNGKAAVIDAKDEFSIISENALWDSADPPRPVAYVEHFPDRAGSHRSHGDAAHSDHAKAEFESDGNQVADHGHGASGHKSTVHGSHGAGRKPGAGMLAGMLKRDLDGDGSLSGDEIPKRLLAVMENIDLNKDGSLDEAELKKMADSFAAKRKGSRQSSRDPIVYGVAANSKRIFVRTGTRLYAIGGE
jgi:outer membrane protein assembly factor BamB